MFQYKYSNDSPRHHFAIPPPGKRANVCRAFQLFRIKIPPHLIKARPAIWSGEFKAQPAVGLQLRLTHLLAGRKSTDPDFEWHFKAKAKDDSRLVGAPPDMVRIEIEGKLGRQ